MRPRILFIFAVSIAFATTVSAQGGTPAATGPCDRACLDGFVDQFLDAYVMGSGWSSWADQMSDKAREKRKETVMTREQSRVRIR